jgi:hypothetical protein
VGFEAAASECTHTYGAPYESFGFQGGGGGPSEGAKEARIDGWMHHPVDNVSGYGQFMPAETDGWAHHQHGQFMPAETDGWVHHQHGQFIPAETDGWAHHQHIQVPGETEVAFDGWAHHPTQVTVSARKPAVNFIGAPTPEGSNWRNCFTSGSTYKAWMKAQVGMPKCGPVNP